MTKGSKDSSNSSNEAEKTSKKVNNAALKVKLAYRLCCCLCIGIPCLCLCIILIVVFSIIGVITDDVTTNSSCTSFYLDVCDDDLEKLSTYSASSSFNLNGSIADI